MRTFVVFITALLGTAVVSTVLFTALSLAPAVWMRPATVWAGFEWERAARLAAYTFSAATTAVVILGAPAFGILARMRWVRWWSGTLVGFLLGCLPAAIWSWPLKSASPGTTVSVAEGKRLVQIMVNGVPTLAGWLHYARGVVEVGLCGAVGGLVFWYIWRSGVQVIAAMSTRK